MDRTIRDIVLAGIILFLLLILPGLLPPWELVHSMVAAIVLGGAALLSQRF